MTVVDMIPSQELFRSLFFIVRNNLIDLLKENSIKFVNEVKIEKIMDEGVEVIDKNTNNFT